jgi:hypothetical protein
MSIEGDGGRADAEGLHLMGFVFARAARALAPRAPHRTFPLKISTRLLEVVICVLAKDGDIR